MNHLPNWNEPKLYWQRGYSAFTFWDRDQRVVIQYVERQREHHALGNWVKFAPDDDRAAPTLGRIVSEALLVEEWEKTEDDEVPWGKERFDR